MQTSNRLLWIAALVAFVSAAIVVLTGLMGPILVVPFALIPLCAGIGILRNRIWSAYGYATFLFAQLLLIPLYFLRPGYSTGRLVQLIPMSMGTLGLGVLFLFAGRSLASAGGRRGRAWPWIIVAALSVVPFFFVQTFKVPSESMENTLMPGDSILAQVFPVRVLARGQVIIFISPTARDLILTKRVIAVPGDRLRISKDVVILNGTALNERYVTHESGGETFYPEDFPNDVELPGCVAGHEMLSKRVVNGEIVVPAGSYFVLGDNRANSLDSRCWGFVSSSELVGRPFMIYDSIERDPNQATEPNQDWLGHRRWGRLFRFL